MSATPAAPGQLELLPDREDWETELRRVHASLRLARRLTFERAMQSAPIATCIRNIAHARRKKGARR